MLFPQKLYFQAFVQLVYPKPPDFEYTGPTYDSFGQASVSSNIPTKNESNERIENKIVHNIPQNSNNSQISSPKVPKLKFIDIFETKPNSIDSQNNPVLIQCPKCPHRSKSKSHLARHEKKRHAEIRCPGVKNPRYPNNPGCNEILYGQVRLEELLKTCPFNPAI